MTPPGTHRTARFVLLDALRGWAILLVMLRHAWPEVFGAAGIVGVVIFFTLSGYLITGILRRDIEQGGKVNFARFYTHRALRLLPALTALLVIVGLVEGVLNLTGRASLVPQSLLLGATYTINLPGLPETIGTLNHLWTLATEEQFYLVWPLVLGVALRRRRMKMTLLIAGALIMIALTLSLLLVRPSYVTIYSWPTSWAIAMLIGSATQIYERQIRQIIAGTRFWAATGGVTAYLLTAAVSLVPDAKEEWWAYIVIGPAVSFASAVMIVAIVSYDWRAPFVAATLARLGTVSYAAYLWNVPMDSWTTLLPVGAFQPILGFALTLACAGASWVALEKPANQLRRKLDQRVSNRMPMQGAVDQSSREVEG